MKSLIVLLFITTFVVMPFEPQAFAQSADTLELPNSFGYIDSDSARYKEYDYASIVIDYTQYYAVMEGDGYHYQILIVDSLLITRFESTESPDFNYVSFQKQRLLTDRERESLNALIIRTKIHQKSPGAPGADFSGSAREELFICTPSMHLHGGLAWGTIGTADSPIASERRSTSTIAGDYDAFLKGLSKLFPQLRALEKESAVD